MSKQPRTSRSGKSAVASAADQADSLGYEAAVERLEAIIDRIESGDIGLEQSLSEYEQGVKLLRRCREILAQAEQKVIELTPEAQATPARPSPDDDQ